MTAPRTGGCDHAAPARRGMGRTGYGRRDQRIGVDKQCRTGRIFCTCQMP